MADYQMLGMFPEKSDRLKMWVRGLAIMGAASFKRRGSNWSAPTELFIHLELRRAERTSCCCIGLKEKEVVGSVPSRAGVGPLFSPGISGPRPAHFFHGSGNWINEATVQLVLSCSFFVFINTMVQQIM